MAFIITILFLLAVWGFFEFKKANRFKQEQTDEAEDEDNEKIAEYIRQRDFYRTYHHQSIQPAHRKIDNTADDNNKNEICCEICFYGNGSKCAFNYTLYSKDCKRMSEDEDENEILCDICSYYEYSECAFGYIRLSKKCKQTFENKNDELEDNHEPYDSYDYNYWWNDDYN